jgi:Na+/citrate or Na+/malate symporter
MLVEYAIMIILLVVIAGLAAMVIYHHFASRRSSSLFMILAVLPVLAGGAASGHWSAAIPLMVALAAIPLMQWVNTRCPLDQSPQGRRSSSD